MDITHCKLTKVYINDTKKDGAKLLTKDGRPYRKIAIQTDKHAGYLSDFIFRDDDEKLTWKVGDEVEIIVYQNGDFWNFKVPSRQDFFEERLEKVENEIKFLKDLMNTPGERIIKHDTIEELENEIIKEDIPFMGVEEDSEIPF